MGHLCRGCVQASAGLLVSYATGSYPTLIIIYKLIEYHVEFSQTTWWVTIIPSGQ